MTESTPLSKIVLISDAWHPQVNGVVTTLNQIVQQLERRGIEVKVFQPNDYKTVPLPTYPEIPWVWSAPHLEEELLQYRPDAIHIATEGGLGWKARNICLKHQLPFTTGYHTNYPQYIHKRFLIPPRWTYAFLRRFHRPAQKTHVPSPSTLKELSEHGFSHLAPIPRGVNTQLFNPSKRTDLPFERPISLYVGRVATEKNLQAFLDLDLPGNQVVVGKGPELESLKQHYPKAHFVGAKFGEELATYYASADVFVFPSKTDTYGVVNIEAMACGLPVAAFPVTGPKDIVTPGVNGWLDNDLKSAIEKCLMLDRSAIPDSIQHLTWQGAADRFFENLAPISHGE